MHGAVLLRRKHFTEDEIERIITDHRSAGLPETDVAILDVVEKIVLHAYKVTPEDVEGLGGHGLTDEEIVDVVVAAAARCFVSKMLDALGADPDADYLEDPALDRLVHSGPFAEGQG